MSNFREIIKEFGTAAGIPGLELDADGLCRIVIDGSTTIDFELGDDEGTLLITGHVLPSVEEAGPEVYASAMLLNMDVAQNKGSFLAYDGAEDEFILMRRLDNTAMRYGDFETVLNEFVAHVDRCRETLSEDLPDDDEDDDDIDDTGAAPASSDMVFRL
jgi:hypothetical protein